MHHAIHALRLCLIVVLCAPPATQAKAADARFDVRAHGATGDGTTLDTAALPKAANARFDVRAHGATGDGATLDTAALQKAIDACAEAGGGQVVFPKGRYLTGSIELKSGVHLVVTPEAVIVGSRALADYATRRLIHAKEAHDISISGGGTIDGQGHTFWEKRDPYQGPPYRGTAQFEYRALSRPQFIHFLRCRNVRIEDIALKDSPSWTVHLQRCQAARLQKVTVRNFLYGPNTDGFDINSCVDVLIRDCDIITGDDGVVLKSTEPGHDHPSRNITVEGCRIWSACNALKIGTETHDSFENITFRKCHLYCDSDKSLERPLSGVAIESVDGAHLSGITVEDITMHNVRAPLFVRLGHRGGNSPRTQQVEPRVPGKIQKVLIRNVTATKSMFESSITGIPGHYVGDVTLENVRLEYEGGGNADWVLARVPDESRIRSYPEAQMYGHLPACGLYCRHAGQVTLRDLTVTCLTPDPRPTLVCDDVQNLTLQRLTASAPARGLPVIWLLNVPQALVQDCTAPAGTDLFVAAEGAPEALTGVRLEACDTRRAATPLARLTPGGLLDASLPLLGELASAPLLIEAEAMRLLDPMTAQPDAGVPSGRCIVVPLAGMRDRGEAACRFQVSTPGDYAIWARTFSPSGESNSLYVSVDHGPRVLLDLNRLGAWNWDRVRDRTTDKAAAQKPALFRLDRGVHTLWVTNRESGTRLDALVIVRADKTFDPARDLPSP